MYFHYHLFHLWNGFVFNWEYWICQHCLSFYALIYRLERRRKKIIGHYQIVIFFNIALWIFHFWFSFSFRSYNFAKEKVSLLISLFQLYLFCSFFNFFFCIASNVVFVLTIIATISYRSEICLLSPLWARKSDKYCYCASWKSNNFG